MPVFDSEGSIKKFLLQYLMGVIAYFGLLIGVFIIFGDSEPVGIDSEGNLDIGPPQTYFEAMYSIGPEVMFIAMLLSAGLVLFITNFRKGVEALIVGLACSLLIGTMVTMYIETEFNNNFYYATGVAMVGVVSSAKYASCLFIGNLFLWANFLLEAFRLKPKAILSE